METHRQGRTGTASAVSREIHARRLLLALRDICRQLRRAQRNREARQAYLKVEKDLLKLVPKRPGSGRRK